MKSSDVLTLLEKEFPTVLKWPENFYVGLYSPQSPLAAPASRFTNSMTAKQKYDLCVEENYKFNWSDRKIKDIFFHAAYGNVKELSKLKSMLESSEDFFKKLNYSRVSDGFTPLMLAAFNGHTAVVKWLLDQGVEVAPNKTGICSALYYATKNNHDETVAVLLSNVRVQKTANENFHPFGTTPNNTAFYVEPVNANLTSLFALRYSQDPEITEVAELPPGEILRKNVDLSHSTLVFQTANAADPREGQIIAAERFILLLSPTEDLTQIERTIEYFKLASFSDPAHGITRCPPLVVAAQLNQAISVRMLLNARLDPLDPISGNLANHLNEKTNERLAVEFCTDPYVRLILNFATVSKLNEDWFYSLLIRYQDFQIYRVFETETNSHEFVISSNLKQSRPFHDPIIRKFVDELRSGVKFGVEEKLCQEFLKTWDEVKSELAENDFEVMSPVLTAVLEQEQHIFALMDSEDLEQVKAAKIQLSEYLWKIGLKDERYQLIAAVINPELAPQVETSLASYHDISFQLTDAFYPLAEKLANLSAQIKCAEFFLELNEIFKYLYEHKGNTASEERSQIQQQTDFINLLLFIKNDEALNLKQYIDDTLPQTQERKFVLFKKSGAYQDLRLRLLELFNSEEGNAPYLKAAVNIFLSYLQDRAATHDTFAHHLQTNTGINLTDFMENKRVASYHEPSE